MKKINNFLDDAAEITNSDYKTAKLIGCSRQLVSNARKTGVLGENSCVKLASLLNVDPAEVIRASNIAKHPENEKVWQKWVAAAAILACVGFAGIPVESMDYSVFSMLPFIHYAHIKIGQKYR